jgi:hypothetical protein
MPDFWQHVVALSVVLAAAAWLVRRQFRSRPARRCQRAAPAGADGFVSVTALTTGQGPAEKTGLLTPAQGRYVPAPTKRPCPTGFDDPGKVPTAPGGRREGFDEGQSGSGAADPRGGGRD